MAFLDRFRRKPESRGAFGYGGPTISVGNQGYGPVNPDLAQTLAAVTACVDAQSGAISGLPATIFRNTPDGGRVEATTHPAARLIRSGPNSWQTWNRWISFTVSQILLWGNSLSVIEFDARGAVQRLVPVAWRSVRCSLLPSGRLVYDITSYQQPFGGTGESRRFLDDEVLHIRGRSDDAGYTGRSAISRAGAAVNNALSADVFAQSVFKNQAAPKGMLALPTGVAPEEVARARAWFDSSFQGEANAGRTILMNSGAEYTPISVSAEDAQLLASRQFSVIEIARLFNTPPPIIQAYENNAFTSAQQASIWWATNTLAPMVSNIEAEFNKSVLADPSGDLHLEIDLSELVRGDYATRWVANVAAVQAGIVTVDEIRRQESYPPMPKAAAAPVVEPAA